MTKRVTRPHKPKGFAPKEPPPSAAKRIESLAALGHSTVGIARGLNTSADTLRRWLDEHPELAEAIARGREAEEFALHNVLYRAAMKGNIVAAIYLTKAKFGWREGDQSDSVNRVSITFTLPAAVKPEDFAKVIQHEPTNPDKPVSAARITRA